MKKHQPKKGTKLVPEALENPDEAPEQLIEAAKINKNCGIMTRQEYQAMLLEMAAGKRKLDSQGPKIWFASEEVAKK